MILSPHQSLVLPPASTPRLNLSLQTATHGGSRITFDFPPLPNQRPASSERRGTEARGGKKEDSGQRDAPAGAKMCTSYGFLSVRACVRTLRVCVSASGGRLARGVWRRGAHSVGGWWGGGGWGGLSGWIRQRPGAVLCCAPLGSRLLFQATTCWGMYSPQFWWPLRPSAFKKRQPARAARPLGRDCIIEECFGQQSSALPGSGRSTGLIPRLEVFSVVCRPCSSKTWTGIWHIFISASTYLRMTL